MDDEVVVDFFSAVNSREKKEGFEEEETNLNEILDYADEFFPEAGSVVITVSKGSVLLASSIEDYEMLKNLIISGMVKVLETGDNYEV